MLTGSVSLKAEIFYQ